MDKMEFKEDFKEAKERIMAWWDHEIIDRPAIGYYMPRPDCSNAGMWDHWSCAKNWDAIEKHLDNFESRSKTIYFGAECFPRFFPNYGPGIMASVFGIKPLFKSNTVWFNQPTKIDEIVPLLESVQLNDNNEWYKRLIHVHDVAAQRAKNKFSVTVTDLGGILDILASFLGPEGLILAMKRHPSIVDTCRQIILEKWTKVYDEIQKKIDAQQGGCNSWMNIYCEKHWYPIQCDFSAMLSPKYFERFVLPDVIAQTENMDYSIYHLDGPNAVPHLDILLKIPRLTGIQWVPGDGRPHHGDIYMEIYKKVQNAGKNLVIDAHPEIIAHLYDVLEPKGLFVSSIFIGKIIADYYLPKFMGGMGGIDDEDE